MLTKKQIESMGLRIVAFSAGNYPVVEATNNPDAEAIAEIERWLKGEADRIFKNLEPKE